MRMLDLYCGAGGAAMGYWHSGLVTGIVGVDHEHQSRYPFECVKSDALAFLKRHGGKFDIIHASPPCQAYSRTSAIWNRRYPALIEPTRDLILRLGKPYIIEMVTSAPLQGCVTMLCGTMFDLRVFRHRYFETSQLILGMPHLGHGGKRAVAVGRRPIHGEYMTIAGHFSDVAYARQAMGIDWMTRKELAQAIPPAYTEWLGKQLMGGCAS